MLTDAALNGDYTRSRAYQLRLDPLIDALFSEVNPIPVKAAMRLLGYDCGQCRLPLSEISESAYKKLEKALSL